MGDNCDLCENQTKEYKKMVIKIHIYLFLMMAYMYACGMLDVFFVYYVFVIMHELAHILVALLCKVDVPEITLLPIGINAKYEGKISTQKEFLISLAGPLASFLFFRIIKNPLYSTFNLIICLINLMPVLPFDGGKILNSFLKKENKFKINNFVSKIFALGLFYLGIYQMLIHKNYYFIIFAGYVYSISKEELKKEKLCRVIDYLQTKQETVN